MRMVAGNIAMWVAAVLMAICLAVPAATFAQQEDEEEGAQERPIRKKGQPRIPGPDVLRKRLENLRVPANSSTRRETPTPTATPEATPAPVATSAPATQSQGNTRPRGSGSGNAGSGGEGQSFGNGLVQTNPKTVKALPWNTKVTLGQIDDTDLEEVIKTISRVTARNFIYDKKDVRNQKVTILTPSPLTVGEAYQAFQTALEGAGLTLVQVGPNLIRIIPRREAAQKPLDTEAGVSVPWNDSFVTRIIRLQNIDVGQIQGIIQQLASKDGAQVQAFAPTNSLIVTDTANNIRRLAKIIDELDRSGGEENIEVLQIKFADVNSIAEMIQQLFGSQGAAGAAPRPAPGVRRPGRGRPAKPITQQGTPGNADAAPLVSKVIPDERTNQVIVVANDRAIQALRDFLEQIDVRQDDGANIHVYYLENADAEALATVLSNLAQGGNGGVGGRAGRPAPGGVPGQPGQAGGNAVAVLQGDVKITADKATNALVITASKADYQAISSVIAKLDIRRQQVYVEAVVLELSVTRSREIGLSYGGAFDAGRGATGFGGFNAGNALFLDPSQLATGFALGLIGPGGITMDVPGPDGSTIPLSIPPFGVTLNALQTDSDVNVLSRPNILAMENEEAEIIVATQIAVPGNVTVSQTGLQNFSITKEDVGITLKVTPKINESDYIAMALFQEVKSLGQQQIVGNQRLVDTSKRSAKTNVVVKNGETIVIGGLLADEDTKTETKIPFLGDIPFLGWLFRNENRRGTKTNLLIFLTPTIIKDEHDMRRIYERRIREREQFLQLYGNRTLRKEAKGKTMIESHYRAAEPEKKVEEEPPIIFAPVEPPPTDPDDESAVPGHLPAPAETRSSGDPDVDPEMVEPERDFEPEEESAAGDEGDVEQDVAPPEGDE